MTEYSALRSLNALNRRLEHCLAALRAHEQVEPELRAIASELLAAIEQDPDILLAAIMLNQIVGAYAVRHCTEAAIVACLVARTLAVPREEILTIAAAALTMNLGMPAQADLFQGKESALSSAERTMLRRHPADSVDILRWAGITDEEWLALVHLHHENADGSGYPEGRAGQKISRNARLISMADRYCAYVSSRNYRRSLVPPVALEKLQEECRQTDAILVQCFANVPGAYPVGTLVRLENGETGVVSRAANGQLPVRVHVLRDARGVAMTPAEERTGDAPGCAVAQALHEDEARLRFTMQQVWGARASL